MAKQKTSRKAFATTAAAVMAATAVTPVAAFAASKTSFPDVPAGEYAEAINNLAGQGILNGFEDGTFRPNDPVLRQEAAKILTNALKLDKTGTEKYPDVTTENWSYEYIVAVTKAGIFGGDENGNFKPFDNLTREQAAKIIVEAFGFKGSSELTFGDKANIQSWAVPYVKTAVANGILKGDDQGNFNPNANIKRGDFALMIQRALNAVEEVKTPKVESVSVINPTVLQVKLKEAKTGLVADNFKVLVDGKEVTPTAISGETNGEIYTITIPSLEGKAGRVSVNGTEATFDFSFPKVEGVTALNASELLVTFNKDVDVPTAQRKDNYELKINDKKIGLEDILDISASGKTAKILLDSDVAFRSGDKYIIQTNDGIKTTEGKLFDKFVSDEKTFNGSLAPSLKSIKVDANGLLVEFDRPVNSYDTNKDVTLIKIDGVAIASQDLKPVEAKTDNADVLGKAGQYTYRVTLTDDELKAASEVGTHEVVIYDVKDTASEYPKVASVLNGEYTITDKVTAPQVTGIEALNANKFFVYTNTLVNLDENTKLKVEKGNHEFKLVDSNFDSTLNTEDTLVDAVAGLHPINGKPGIYVVVTDDVKGDDENPLYKNGETSVTLKVTLENYTANGLIGKKAEQTVTLNRNNTKPAVKETAINGDNLEVTFTNALASLDGEALNGLTADDVVIRDKDGIVKSPSTDISVTGSKVTIPLTSTNDGPYTVEFKAGKFKNLEVRGNVENYLVNTLKNDKLVATVAAKDNNFKYYEFDLAEANLEANDNNQITFSYPVEMSDSARNVANYTLDGKALPAGSTVDFVGDKKNVRITLPTGTLKASTKYKLGIKTDVTTAAGTHIVGSLQTKAPAEAIIELKDNVAPELKSALFLISDETVKPSTETDLIEVTFNENLANIANDATSQNDFKVVINGSTVGVEAVNDGTQGDDKLVIKLKQKVNVNQAATISIIPEEQQTGTLDQKEIVIKDVAGNKANTSKTINVSGSKYSSSNVGNPTNPTNPTKPTEPTESTESTE